MGTSTNASLVYGIDLNEIGYCGEDEHPAFFIEEDEFDFDAFLLRVAGLAKWGWDKDSSKCEPWEDYIARKNQAKELAGVDLVIHCNNEDPMFILAVPDVELLASRGCPHAFDELPIVTQPQIDKLKAFCDKHGIPWQKPQWILNSYWD